MIAVLFLLFSFRGSSRVFLSRFFFWCLASSFLSSVLFLSFFFPRIIFPIPLVVPVSFPPFSILSPSSSISLILGFSFYSLAPLFRTHVYPTLFLLPALSPALARFFLPVSYFASCFVSVYLLCTRLCPFLCPFLCLLIRLSFCSSAFLSFSVALPRGSLVDPSIFLCPRCSRLQARRFLLPSPFVVG